MADGWEDTFPFLRRDAMSRRRTGGAGSKAGPQVDEKSVKLNLSLPPDLARRFGVHAEMVGMSKSELFAELVRAGCKRFVVSDRERTSGDLADPDAA
jgi:hypothetical protein